jgi:uncharacterized membrane protein YcaP (DUF421 family)
MELVVRATIVYWLLWLVVRGTGKRSLAQMSPLDLLLLVVIGDIVQQGVTQEDMSLTGAGLAVESHGQRPIGMLCRASRGQPRWTSLIY